MVDRGSANISPRNKRVEQVVYFSLRVVINFIQYINVSNSFINALSYQHCMLSYYIPLS